jgi:Cdc6-like AAA superfamily ATPase
VLYQLFDWPNQPGSRLAVIGISNTHDLDQRVLPRIASRLDQAKLAFAPYSVAQLQTIVGQRLQESGVAGAVEDMAVMLTCRKVASETGGHVLGVRGCTVCSEGGGAKAQHLGHWVILPWSGSLRGAVCRIQDASRAST